MDSDDNENCLVIDEDAESEDLLEPMNAVEVVMNDESSTNEEANCVTNHSESTASANSPVRLNVIREPATPKTANRSVNKTKTKDDKAKSTPNNTDKKRSSTKNKGYSIRLSEAILKEKVLNVSSI